MYVYLYLNMIVKVSMEFFIEVEIRVLFEGKS